jgi:aryl-alcohol dehydrogenase-like predicted oxidoreductase
MQIRRLGISGLYVSQLGLGTMTFGAPDWGCDEETASRLVDRYLEAGGNLIDTADIYGCEEIVGRALGARRSQVVIATKFGLPSGLGPHDRGGGRKHIVAACEASLRRLGTDYIDLYQLHVDDMATPLEETIGALADLVRAGKVLYIGASNMRAYRLMTALSVSDRLGAARFVAFQGQYSLIVRGLEREHFPLFSEQGLGLLSWGPLGAGMLTGKMKPGRQPVDTRLGQRVEWAGDNLFRNDHGFKIAAMVEKAAADIGCTPAQLALAWQRTRPVTSVILGVRTMAQLEDNLRSLDIIIPTEILDRIDQSSRLPDEYPTTFVDTLQGLLARGRSNVPRK